MPALDRTARVLALVLSCLAVSACAQPVGPGSDDGPAQPPPEEPAPPDTTTGPLRGFGLKADPGATAVTLVASGSDSTTCERRAAGLVRMRLPITGAVLAALEATWDGAGRAFVRPVTTHFFSGRGRLSYAEAIEVASSGRVLHTFTHGDAVEDPDPPVGDEVTPELGVIRGDVRVGDTLMVTLAGEGTASLGTWCGSGTAGQVQWRVRGVVLWLER
ncbi:MAG: hypothetical protein R3E98_00150 [Gemmatimonadota bacterium]